MYKKLSLILLLAFSLPITNTMACEAAGANTHVGNIVSLDQKSRTLTIMDVATRKPIQFALNDALMIKLNGISGQVVVRYSGEQNGQLIATQILQ